MNYLAKALGELRPKEGMIYNSELPPIANKIIYDSESTIKITQEELDNKIQEIKDRQPLRLLRIERDRKLTEVDWWTSRALDGTPLTTEQTAYRQALRDLPENSANVAIDENGTLINVEWPVKPE